MGFRGQQYGLRLQGTLDGKQSKRALSSVEMPIKMDSADSVLIEQF